MAGQPYHIIIRGLPHIPAITEVNARSGPGTNFDIVAKLAIGLEFSQVKEITQDNESKGFNDKTYLWFCLPLHDGRQAWVRDDLLDLFGDCTPLGYGIYKERTFAFDQRRLVAEKKKTATLVMPVAMPDEAPPQPAPITPVSPADELDRVRRAAFAITAAFEGAGYGSYQNYDAGVVSYGRFQFTLNAGTLATVVTRYLERSRTPQADALRAYHMRINARDASLRNDMQLKQALINAADDPLMKQVQNEIATEGYWNRMLEISARPRGIQSPLGLALVFDVAINFGVMNRMLSLAEEELGVPPKSRLGENGITEHRFIMQLADRRRRAHYAQADRDNLPGLKARGDFWVNLATQNDFGLQGDAQGFVYPNGKPVQVRAPEPF